MAAARVRPASYLETSHLFQLQAIKTRAKQVTLVEHRGLASIAQVLLPGPLGAAILSLPTLPPLVEAAPAQIPLALPAPDPSALALVPGASPSAAAAPRDLPITLPDCTVPVHRLKKHFSLPAELLEQEPLCTQLEELHAWCTAGIQLDRQGGGICSRTWGNLHKSIVQLLGFCNLHLRMRGLTLATFLDADAYGHFTAFMLAKQNALNTVTHHLAHFRKVIAFLMKDLRGREFFKAQELQDWLRRLAAQVSTLLPRRLLDPGELELQQKWIRPAKLLRGIEALRLHAKELVPSEGLCSPTAARLLHDAALSSTMFGHIPPLRLMIIRTMQLPESQGCVQEDCTKVGCIGNRLELGPADSVTLVISHHKNQKRWQQRVLRIKLPEELADLLLLFLTKAHPVACPRSDHLFTRRNGRPFEDASHLNPYWNRMLRRMGCDAQIPPHRLRHIFVDERRSNTAAEGPQNAGAAMVMGNSERAWDRAYDPNFQSREAQAAVDAMAAWRRELLSRPESAEDARRMMEETLNRQLVMIPDADLDDE